MVLTFAGYRQKYDAALLFNIRGDEPLHEINISYITSLPNVGNDTCGIGSVSVGNTTELYAAPYQVSRRRTGQLRRAH